MARVLIGLGSNIEPRRDYLKLAVAELSQAPCEILVLSPVYETEAMDVKDQASFLNMAALLETNLEPLSLLEHLQAIEVRAHKQVLIRRGPRTLDLDLWSHGDTIMDTETLVLPHPRIPERPFVLVPLMDVAPQWRHPLNGLTARQMLEALPKPWPVVKLLGNL
jgi:2-amino-4-hydroxy-6-hydroxymethyldihydropteridine diphosphokinase